MIVIIGAAGQLGTAFREILGSRAVYLTRPDADLVNVDSIRNRIAELRPTTLINCASYNAVDRAETEPELASAVNTTAVRAMAEAAAESACRFVTYSTDYVFDGALKRPYVESDPSGPLNVYGTTKRDGETAALAANETSLVIRTSWLLSGTHFNFAATMIDRARKGEVSVVDDQRGHPTLANALARSTLAAVESGATGILHLANRGTVSRYELAREAVELAGGDPTRIRPCSTATFAAPAKRPANGVLDSERSLELGLEPLPHYRNGLETAVSEIVTWLP